MSILHLLSSVLLSTALIVILLEPATSGSASAEWEPSAPRMATGILAVDRIRLGSTPPSCHNRCNGCSPCMAVQVPAMPEGRERRPRSGSERKMVLPTDGGERGGAAFFRGYPNYKPLGWKCRCQDRLFNP